MSHAVKGHPRRTGHDGEFWQNVVHWRREWQTTSVFLRTPEQYEKKRWGPFKANVVKFIKGWEMFILIKSVPALSCTEGFSNHTDVCNLICSSSHYFYEINGTDLNTSISWWETRHWDIKTPVWIHIFSHTRAKLDLQQCFLTPSQKCHPSHLFSP